MPEAEDMKECKQLCLVISQRKIEMNRCWLMLIFNAWSLCWGVGGRMDTWAPFGAEILGLGKERACDVIPPIPSKLAVGRARMGVFLSWASLKGDHAKHPVFWRIPPFRDKHT